jgi:cytochrome oxidase Cu insertion factor (SCO1/SenC/PrrC family)
VFLMRRRWTPPLLSRLAAGALLAAFLIIGLTAPRFAVAAQKEKPTMPPLTLKVGDPAPDFTLKDQNQQPVTLSGFRGKKQVVLAFYVFAFTGG